MECHCIPFAEIPRASRLFQDFLYHFDKVASFYAWDPTRAESFSQVAEKLCQEPSARAIVAQVLERQNREFGASGKTFHNIARLGRGEALAVVTGQQVGLLTGPAYSVYKALTAIRLAAQLETQGIPAVPVFWLATEDHDLQEINHTYLLDARYQLRRIEHRAQHAGSRRVGEVLLGEESNGLAAEVAEILSGWPGGKAWADVVVEACRDGQSYGRSFARMMTRIFEGQGVILLDPLDRELHKLAAPVFSRVIREANELEQALAARSDELERAAYHTQARILEEGALFFVNVEGERRSVRRRDSSFWIRGAGRAHAHELLEWLERTPEDFTANVLLRPIVQDTLLPTVAYVGGPAEVAYLAESEVLYRRLLGRMPVIFPRASFTLVDARARRLMKKYSLDLKDIFAGRQMTNERMMQSYVPGKLRRRLAQSERRLEALLSNLEAPLTEFDPTLGGALEMAGRKMRYQLEKIRTKAARAEAAREALFDEHRRVLENLLYPNRNLQERQLNFLPFLSRYGSPLLARLGELALGARDHHVVYL